MLDSLEGEVVLNAGAFSPDWAPYTQNPFIELADPDHAVLEIRRVVPEGQGDPDQFVPPHTNILGWGSIACGGMTVHGNIHSAYSGSGGAYIDEWGNMRLNGGSWGCSWNVYNDGNRILQLPDSRGVTFYDGNGNAKVGITNGGNISANGTMTLGAFAQSSTP